MLLGIDTPNRSRKLVAMRLAELEFDGILVEVAPGKYQARAGTEAYRQYSHAAATAKRCNTRRQEDNLIFVAERNSMHLSTATA